MKKLIQDWFTERDGVSWCIGRAMGAWAFVEVCFQFGRLPVDQIVSGLQVFCLGVAGIIAAIGFKNSGEKE